MTRLPNVHVVTDDRILTRKEFITIATALMDYPIALHLRGRETPGRELHLLATTIHDATQSGTLVINDRVDVAIAADLGRVHLPERGLPPHRVKETFGTDLVVGVSTHTHAAAERAFGSGADYVFHGPVWTTPSHPERQPLGTESLGGMPGSKVLAIGGVTHERVTLCTNAGAYGVAVISAVWDSPNPVSAVRALCDIFQEQSN